MLKCSKSKTLKVNLFQVVGVPDERLGEEIVAFIQLKDGHSCDEENIKKYCKDKVILNQYK